ncbi:hypothetical protein [Qaidamihabitans albus]|uniref:hypothetical protein n=1 Tax=Qaidamihabitans albus TaxID=2795733 RepID=UPI0018F17B4A|nr:hypothetical protein [Qaidamihabitans albus]
MAVRLDVEPAPIDTADPEPSRLGARFGLALLKLSARRSGQRWPADFEASSDGREITAQRPSRPLVLLEDPFALRTLCRA